MPAIPKLFAIVFLCLLGNLLLCLHVDYLRGVYIHILAQTDLEKINDLIAGCKAKDRRCQKELYRIFYARSFSICSRYAQNKDDAVSILNEGFFKVFSNIDKYDFKKPFGAWLHRVMTNTSIDFYRTLLRWNENNIDITPNEEIHFKNESVIDHLQYKDLLKMVQDLTPAYRTVFNLYAIEGYTHEEIAQLLSISVGTSKSNLFKARAKLMDMISLADRFPKKSAI